MDLLKKISFAFTTTLCVFCLHVCTFCLDFFLALSSCDVFHGERGGGCVKDYRVAHQLS